MPTRESYEFVDYFLFSFNYPCNRMEQLQKGDQYGAVRSKSSAAHKSHPPQRYIRERLRKE